MGESCPATHPGQGDHASLPSQLARIPQRSQPGDKDVNKQCPTQPGNGRDGGLVRSYEDDLAWHTPPPGVSVRITGQPVLMTTVMDALTEGRVEMSLLGLFLIFVLLLLIYRDLIRALLPVLPMLVVIGWMGLVMYYGGLKYTPLTAHWGALVWVGSEYAIL